MLFIRLERTRRLATSSRCSSRERESRPSVRRQRRGPVVRVRCVKKKQEVLILNIYFLLQPEETHNNSPMYRRRRTIILRFNYTALYSHSLR